MIRMKLKILKFLKISALIFVYVLLLINAFYFKDSPASVISAFFGITYTIFAGFGRPVCYLFGVTGSSFYGYLSFHNSLWGNLILYIGYYIPMQILGFFRWKKHLKSNKNEIIKTELNTEERIKLTLVTLLFTIAAFIILFYTQDKNPLIDAVTAVFSILGMYLTVKRCIEQWIVWMVVNGFSALMWLDIALKGEKVFSTVVMWSVYFVLAIYFYIRWRKEIDGYCAK